MNTVTHALMPVVALRLVAGDKRVGWKSYLGLALAGAAPDLLDPHLALAARWTSWSHGLPFWVAFSLILLLVSLAWRRKLSPWLAAGMSAACALHIFCDAISGGVNLLYPVKFFLWGEYWVDPALWIPLDMVLMILAYILFRWLPGKKQLRHKDQASRY